MTKKANEYYFKEGCYIEEWQNADSDEAMSIARVRVLSDTQTKNHSLKDTTERYVILHGKGLVTIEGQSWQVTQGDVVLIAADQEQKIKNLGVDDLIFLAICTPRFQEHNYRELD